MANQLGSRLPQSLMFLRQECYSTSELACLMSIQLGGSTTISIFPYSRCVIKTLPLLSSPKGRFTVLEYFPQG
ncbi:hypothetical protein [Anabaena sp. CCY 9614]|uniref:hypothetical protein n=1 Tax=Anabaena sp. CCY 9614 TaxID=3103869 RepID=UPI0039C5DBE8